MRDLQTGTTDLRALHLSLSKMSLSQVKSIDYGLESFKSRTAMEMLLASVRKQPIEFQFKDEMLQADIDYVGKTLSIALVSVQSMNDFIRVNILRDTRYQIYVIRKLIMGQANLKAATKYFERAVRTSALNFEVFSEYFDSVTRYAALGILKFCVDVEAIRKLLMERLDDTSVCNLLLQAKKSIQHHLSPPIKISPSALKRE